MIDIVKGSIKDTCYLKIYDCIDRFGKLSRSGIVRKSGLSLSTVNKALDSLLNCGAVVECDTTETDTETGRKSEFFRIGIDSEIGVIDITSDRFLYYTFTKTGLERESSFATFPVLGNPEEHLRNFCVKLKSERFNPNFICAITRPADNSVLNLSDVLLPTPPSSERIAKIINFVFTSAQCSVVTCIESSLFGMSFCKALPLGQRNVYINIDKLLYITVTNVIPCTVSGFIPCGNGKTLYEELKASVSSDEAVTALATFVMSIISTVRPSGIAIYSVKTPSNINPTDKVERKLAEVSPLGLYALNGQLPEIVGLSHSLSVVGAHRLMRKKIFEDMLKAQPTS